MVLAAAIAKISNGKIFTEWFDGSTFNIGLVRNQLHHFLSEKLFLTTNNNCVNMGNFDIHFVREKSCVYSCIVNSGGNKHFIGGLLQNLMEDFEDVHLLCI